MGPLDLRTLVCELLTRKFTRQEMQVDLISPMPGQPVAFAVSVPEAHRADGMPERRRYRVTIEEVPADDATDSTTWGTPQHWSAYGAGWEAAERHYAPDVAEAKRAAREKAAAKKRPSRAKVRPPAQD